MNSISNVILLPSLKTLLGHRLQNIFDLSYPEITEIGKGPINPALINDTQSVLIHPAFPLNQVKDTPHIWYVSAIALKFSSKLKSPAKEIADAIAQELKQPIMIKNPLWGDIVPDENAHHLFTEIFRSAMVWTTDPGWLHWQLTPSGIMAWIRWMVTILKANDGDYSSSLAPSADLFLHQEDRRNRSRLLRGSALFEVQYACARCSALLRWADQEPLLSWVNPPGSNQGADATGVDQWRSPDPTECALLCAIVSTVDQFGSHLTPEKAMQTARELSQRWGEFDAACRLLGHTEQAIAQGRLKLVLIVRSLLSVLLQEYLHSKAPSFL